VVFLYPTRGTATEGFRDYVGWAPEGQSALVHGTSRYELEMMRENPPDALEGKDPRLSETEARLFSLGLWSRRYFSATVDQFLSFLEHHYSSVCLLPLLADSAIVIDEVHSFDRRMFDDLVAFLRAFDVPVLCMTATLGASRRRELEDAGLTLFPRAEHRTELADLEEQERHPRYCITREPSSSFEKLIANAAGAVGEQRRVLWVVNTVARCQALSVRLHERLGSWPLVYHSRFRLKDRQAVHGRVVEAFQTMKPAIAVTTQVCEMSLDLDADMLVTELAPVSALVQRFGRSNRHRARGDAFRASIHVYSPDSVLPYERAELTRADEFVNSVHGETSQRALAEALERFARSEPVADGSARFLDGGYFAVPGPFRDGDERAGPCVLDADLPEIEQRIARRKPYDDLVLSVPTRAHANDRPSWLPRHLGVVPAQSYDSTLGFMVS
jgi:CRISPR-associated endonuclease/helicase Cas3